MATTPQTPLTVRVSSEIKENFESAFEESGFSSKGDFLNKLLSAYYESLEPQKPSDPAAPAVKQEVVEKIVEVEKERSLQENEILLSLNPAQLFVLRENFMRNPSLAAGWNSEIEKFKSGKAPFLYFGNLCNAEYGCIWNEFVDMQSPEDQEALKRNMAAELLNYYMVQIVEGNIPHSVITPRILKDFIRDQKAKQTDQEPVKK